MVIVMIPLMIAAGIFTHITARHSVARQTAAQAENPQTAIMNRLMLYIFPVGVVVGAPFLPLAVLLYWVSNNLWTLGQQYVVYKRIDVEESAKREQADVTRQARAPRPGQKPVRPEAPVEEPKQPAKRPGAKPITRKPASPSSNGAAPAQESKDTSGNGDTSLNGSQSGNDRGARSGGGSRPPARRPRKRR
jgi:YidC/Oxa1 family membrane protein insertase